MGVLIRKIKLKTVLKFLISFSILGVLLYHMDSSTLLSSFESINAKAFLCAVGLAIVQIFLLNLRWHDYMNIGAQDIPFHTNSLVNILGFFANLLFIASVGGVITKYAFAVRCGLSYMRAFFVTCLDRVMTLISLVLLSAISLPFVDALEPAMKLTLSILILGLLFSMVIVVSLLRIGVFKEFILSSRKRARFVAIMRSYLENAALMRRTIFYSIMAHVCFIFSAYVLSGAIDYGVDDLNVTAFIALMPILALISCLPISIGGWGVREGVFVFGLGLIGYSMESAFSLSVQLGAVYLVSHCIVVVPYLLKQDLSTFIISKTSKVQKP